MPEFSTNSFTHPKSNIVGPNDYPQKYNVEFLCLVLFLCKSSNKPIANKRLKMLGIGI